MTAIAAAVVTKRPRLVAAVPLRGGLHPGNVAAEALATRDLLDIVSSDCDPSALLLSAFHHAQIWSHLPRASANFIRNPVQATRLDDRGVLNIGMLGDVLRVRQAGVAPLLGAVWRQGQKSG